MKSINKKEFPQVSFGKNCNIFAEDIIIEPGSSFGENVEIRANNIRIGINSKIERNTTIKAIKGDMSDFILGDNTFIGFGNQILTPYFQMMDYSQIHNNGLLSGYKPLSIGYNCWIGQNVILNSFETLSIGNNVRMGGCQIWTHVAAGELLEGCKFHGSSPVIIEDNVWLMGFGHMIVPGITLARNSIIMAGSVVTKSTEPYQTYSGIPAKKITEKLNGWVQFTIDEKWELLKKFTDEFIALFPAYKNRVIMIDDNDKNEHFVNQLNEDQPCLLFYKKINDVSIFEFSKHTPFDLSTKKYLKKRNDIEIDWFRFADGFRARFIPFIKI